VIISGMCRRGHPIRGEKILGVREGKTPYIRSGQTHLLYGWKRIQEIRKEVSRKDMAASRSGAPRIQASQCRAG